MCVSKHSHLYTEDMYKVEPHETAIFVVLKIIRYQVHMAQHNCEIISTVCKSKNSVSYPNAHQQ